MKYLEPSFSTLPPAGATYRDNHDRIFGKKDVEQPLPEDAHLKDESATTEMVKRGKLPPCDGTCPEEAHMHEQGEFSEWRGFKKKTNEDRLEERIAQAEADAGSYDPPSSDWSGDDPQAGGLGLSLAEVQIINVGAYVDDLIAKADSVADSAYGGGPGKMKDHARWGEAVCVSSILNDVRTCLRTGERTPHHLWEPPPGASRD